MIGRIQGEVVDKSQQHILVDVGGVGYEVQVPEIIAQLSLKQHHLVY